jgi:hypothetical protein
MLASLVNACGEAKHFIRFIAADATARSNVGLPFVNVPVLSMIRVSTLRKFSIAEASRNNTPCVAALPVA